MGKKQKMLHTESAVRNKDVNAIRQLDDEELLKAISIYQDSTRDLCRAELQRRSTNEMIALRTSMFSVEKAIREQIQVMTEFNMKSTALTRIVIGIMIISLLVSTNKALGSLIYSISLKFFGLVFGLD